MSPNLDRDPWPGQGEAYKKLLEPLPRETRTLAATAQPLKPKPLGHGDQAAQAARVAVHPEVIEVTNQTSLERRMLHCNREMPMASTPLGDGLDCPSQARMPGLAPHRPTTALGSTPIERKPEEVEGARTFPCWF